MSDNFTTPEGRIVGGHPMDHKPATDDAGKPKVFADGTAQMNTFFYFAIPKNGSTHWNQTELGQTMTRVASAAFKANEVAAPDFSWKILDGDSTVPLKGGKPAPSTREGWPGHWVLRLSSGLPVKCFHNGKFDPMQQIQDRNEVKCGDYGRVYVEIVPNNVNGAAKTNGIYINPRIVSITRAGQQIITDSGPSAAEVFGAATPPVAAAAPPPPPAQQAAPPPPPHNPLPKRYSTGGVEYTYEQLAGYGWTPEQIAAIEVK